jgi:hypothetical protein
MAGENIESYFKGVLGVGLPTPSGGKDEKDKTKRDRDDDFEDDSELMKAVKRMKESREAEANRPDARSYLASQPLIRAPDLHPRNKFKDGGIGKIYNAHRIRVLTPAQVRHLLRKVQTRAMPDGCHVVTKPVVKQVPPGTNFNSTVSPLRPRGVQLDTSMTDSFFDKHTSFECTHVVLASEGRYPESSEHEVSHLCQNPLCVIPTHLIWELHPANVAREACRYVRDVACPNCRHHFSTCRHSPACIACTCSTQSE